MADGLTYKRRVENAQRSTPKATLARSILVEGSQPALPTVESNRFTCSIPRPALHIDFHQGFARVNIETLERREKGRPYLRSTCLLVVKTDNSSYPSKTSDRSADTIERSAIKLGFIPNAADAVKAATRRWGGRAVRGRRLDLVSERSLTRDPTALQRAWAFDTLSIGVSYRNVKSWCAVNETMET
ncbi:hypothetical protein EVAR_13620_1 [Eumeta japonica]|uniref:Uncharacterized protein n=1 Tax=Eumeta variegata TaxID=151549 RepID=A0A4C1UUK3_EUMVA|nr:hypothetical protein EVAR_13620_1 [Eumeta japonica]